MASVIDLHVHTNQGSPDSSLTPEELVAEAQRLGLDGLLGLCGTGGNDAHSVNGLGKGTTVLPEDIRNQTDRPEALRAGAFFPVGVPHRTSHRSRTALGASTPLTALDPRRPSPESELLGN